MAGDDDIANSVIDDDIEYAFSTNTKNMAKMIEQGTKYAKEFHLNVASGEYTNISAFFKFGRSSNIGLTESVIWDGGGDYIFLSSAEFINVVSDNINDTALGSGARTLIIYGLDSNFNEISEIITLNGTTHVKSVKEYLRLFRAIVISSGTNTVVNGGNIGTISFTGFTSSTLQAKIIPNQSQTLMAVYTVPAGKTGYITGGTFSVGSGKSCTFRGRARDNKVVNAPFNNILILDIYQTSLDIKLNTPYKVTEKTDIAITGIDGTPAISASASFGIILINN